MENLQIINCTQGEPEWHSARIGCLTASCYSQILAKGKGLTRRSYMMKIAGERITGNAAESYTNPHMERGKEQESAARELYVAQSGLEVIECGFMKRGNIGYSPDGLIGEDGLLEIKTKLAHLQAEVLLDDKIPSEHIAQIQGGLMVSGRQWLDFVSYCPGMPLFIKRVERDEAYIQTLTDELAKFEAELSQVVTQLMSKF
ncbi:MAG: YqaJ viral recombinase family protein [Gammaproteobacteria bacterium]|nr:YqaJ viral recombinase family protein [Gammaproteobacteria bacterium]